MDISPRIDGSHATASPSGELIAHIFDGKLAITSSRSQSSTSFGIRTPTKGISSVRWSTDGRVAVCSSKTVEIFDLEGSGRVRLENGSGGLGQFTTADFIGSDYLLTTWEFGRAKAWDLANGRGTELGDLKTTCDGAAWQQRPGGSISAPCLALLSRPAAEDQLAMYFPAAGTSTAPVKLPTDDARSLSWSPDGRWLAVLDTPMASTSAYFYTPDAYLFRSYPTTPRPETTGLRVKAIAWSGDSRTVALSCYDGKIELLNTRTFAPLAIIQHTTTIDQYGVSEQAPIWEENVSASGERSYSLAAQPVSPPLSRSKPSIEPAELGVAEASFSCDGSYLATRDERMLSTVWIWDTATLAAHAVMIQHSNVRRMHWHPSQPTLMLDCGERIGYLFDAATTGPPTPFAASLPGTSSLSWLNISTGAAVLATTRSAFRILYPEGRPERANEDEAAEVFDEGKSEDSLLDVLSGRKPLPPHAECSYTERVELETDDVTESLDDTFKEKRKPAAVMTEEVDPLDDSEIF